MTSAAPASATPLSRSISDSPSAVRPTALRVAALAVAAGLVLTGCGQSGTDEGSAGSTPSASAAVDTAAADALSVENAWVKTAKSGMTAVFGTVRNNSDAPITISAAQFDGAKTAQLHETAEDGSGAMSMQEKKGGFVIPAGGSLALEPGGDHIMIMGLTKPIEPGEEVSVDLMTADHRTVTFTAVAKDYSGAQEDYAPGQADASATSDEHDGH